MRRVLVVVGKLSLGVALGLVIAEVAFRIRDDGAFPHVNLYEADAQLGTRLVPNTSQRLAFTGNPATTVRVNSLGFRGGEWPSPVPNELIMVGDSQVFGLGVEEDDTLASELSAKTGRQVLNAGVPTYGPAEYLEVARRVAKQRGGGEVLFVFNVANDFFELDRPNLKRHSVWDGWAVRAENGPGNVNDFPGRRWLFSQSHLVFAARKLWFKAQRIRGDSEAIDAFTDPIDQGVASEGSWTDLLTANERQLRADGAATTHGKAEARNFQERVTPLAEATAKDARALENLEPNGFEGPSFPPNSRVRTERFAETLLAHQVGDVVRDTGSEMARSVTVTAELLAQAAEAKRQFALAKEVARRKAAALAAKSAPIELRLKQQGRALDVARWDLPEPTKEPVLGEALLDSLVEFQKTTARVTVVVLPLDVQVSSDEWKKYGELNPRDMSATLEMNRRFAEAAEARGLRTVNLLQPLVEAEPGAFLLGDLHLTPKGTAAVAAALADGLKREPPEVLTPGLPEGRSLVPSPEEWNAAPIIAAEGAASVRCEVKQVREWARVSCPFATSVRVQPELDTSEMQLVGSYRGSSVVFTVKDRTLGFFFAGDFLFHLSAYIPGHTPQPTYAFGAIRETGEPPATPFVSTKRAALKCFEALSSPTAVPWGNFEERGCEVYDDCVYRLACQQGHPNAKPRCGKNEVNAGSDSRCRKRCQRDADCGAEEGHCIVWQGVHVCR